MAKYIYRSSERLDRKHKSPRSGHSECWQPSMGGVSTPSSHSCSHLAFLHLQVIISGHGKTNFQLPFTRNEEPLHTAACLPACLPLYDSPAEEGRIMEQRQACSLAFSLSPPNGNSSLRGFPYTVSATPLQILLPPPNSIPPF